MCGGSVALCEWPAHPGPVSLRLCTTLVMKAALDVDFLFPGFPVRINQNHGVAMVLLLLLQACGDPPPSSGVEPDTGEVDVPDIVQDIQVAPDVGADVDATDVADAADVPDVTDAGGSVGSPCEDDIDCESGICEFLTAGADVGVCVEYCGTDDDCDRDADCVLIRTSGDDAERICLPRDLCLDVDGDRYGIGSGCLGPDCDDDDGLRNAGAPEVCDGLDNNCNELVDDSPTDADRRCATGSPGVCGEGRTICEAGALSCVAEVLPSIELCNTEDDDCDGLTDEGDDGQPLSRPCYEGPPGTENVGACAGGRQTCESGGYSSCAAQTLPTSEVCDGDDNDCDTQVDENLVVSDWYPDVDGDRFGDAAATATSSCARPTGFVDNRSDCNDGRAAVFPGAAEIPGDGLDSNCDNTELCFADADNDGWRPNATAISFSLDADCDDDGEALVTDPTGDCDDTFAGSYPSAAEACDGEDNDCDVRVDEGAGCYANGEACVEPVDCRTGLCSSGVCVAPLTCVDLGTCPPLAGISAGGGEVNSPNYRARLSVGVPTPSQPLYGSRYTLIVGPAPGLAR